MTLPLLLAALLSQNPQVVVQGRGIDGTTSWRVKLSGDGGTNGTVIAVVGLDAGAVPVTLPVTQTSAFGEVLSATQTVPFTLSFPYNNLNPDMLIITLDGGSATADGGRAILFTTVDGGFAEVESRMGARYVPGQGMSARFTLASPTGCGPGQEQVIGMGDTVDGFFFGCCPSCSADGGGSFGVLRRSSGVDNWVPAAQWNGAWGTTPPDISQGRPYQIQFQWLGYGQITYSIEDQATGGFVTAHAIKYAGTSTETSIGNPTLPLSLAVRNRQSSSPNILTSPSLGVIRQGPEPENGLRRSATGSRSVTTGANELPLLSIRNEANFNGRVNRTRIHVDFFSWSISNNNDATLRFKLNPTLVGATFTSVAAGRSLVSFSTDGTYTPGTGIEWLNLVAEANQSGTENMRLYEILVAPGETLMVSGQTSTGTTVMRVSLSWVEEF